ncbi:MAG TPA: hypothetical protein VN457_08175 [Chlamydiales bacterium]|nr:hypothetical protein [Chlamydiales bacterium]
MSIDRTILRDFDGICNQAEPLWCDPITLTGLLDKDVAFVAKILQDMIHNPFGATYYERRACKQEAFELRAQLKKIETAIKGKVFTYDEKKEPEPNLKSNPTPAPTEPGELDPEELQAELEPGELPGEPEPGEIVPGEEQERTVVLLNDDVQKKLNFALNSENMTPRIALIKYGIAYQQLQSLKPEQIAACLNQDRDKEPADQHLVSRAYRALPALLIFAKEAAPTPERVQATFDALKKAVDAVRDR